MLERDSVNRVRLSQSFSLDEFQSPDTCQVIIHPILLVRLQALHDKLGVPIKINSGYRTRKRNEEVQGSENSFHLYGMAADIIVPILDRLVVARSAVEVGFNGVITYKDKPHIHVDIRPLENKFIDIQ